MYSENTHYFMAVGVLIIADAGFIVGKLFGRRIRFIENLFGLYNTFFSVAAFWMLWQVCTPSDNPDIQALHILIESTAPFIFPLYIAMCIFVARYLDQRL